MLRAITVHVNDPQKTTRTTKQRYRDIDGQGDGCTYRHISSTGTHYGPLEPSVGRIAS